mmetsp:Transcript_24528/g.61756  ORF Transcript_24528/g.61756 Transcript_24528/m.61756 type:complete len:286 (-) Transcript_24528:168-1025(-)|eukprot:CAMPEP_0178988138 /NCGR_PEP_ID=MMETSP0795-20121207/3650_1 /TAXON_ID=88552 /ORGANISM="Amoebophrya sp., Strain Ameob2" /LENGTH=285 /DNA_ID=CAMNT_0020679391 /DNA_START=801 /DNA_END=1658 /DNA_ORIENTATION=+
MDFFLVVGEEVVRAAIHDAVQNQHAILGPLVSMIARPPSFFFLFLKIMKFNGTIVGVRGCGSTSSCRACPFQFFQPQRQLKELLRPLREVRFLREVQIRDRVEHNQYFSVCSEQATISFTNKVLVQRFDLPQRVVKALCVAEEEAREDIGCSSGRRSSSYPFVAAAAFGGHDLSEFPLAHGYGPVEGEADAPALGKKPKYGCGRTADEKLQSRVQSELGLAAPRCARNLDYAVHVRGAVLQLSSTLLFASRQDVDDYGNSSVQLQTSAKSYINLGVHPHASCAKF